MDGGVAMKERQPSPLVFDGRQSFACLSSVSFLLRKNSTLSPRTRVGSAWVPPLEIAAIQSSTCGICMLEAHQIASRGCSMCQKEMSLASEAFNRW